MFLRPWSRNFLCSCRGFSVCTPYASIKSASELALKNISELQALQKIQNHTEKLKFFSSKLHNKGEPFTLQLGDLITEHTSVPELNEILDKFSQSNELFTMRFLEKASIIAHKNRSAELARRLRTYAANAMIDLSRVAFVNIFWTLLKTRDKEGIVETIEGQPIAFKVARRIFRRLLVYTSEAGENIEICFFLTNSLFKRLLNNREALSKDEKSELQNLYYDLLLCFSYSYYVPGVKLLLPMLYNGSFKEINRTAIDRSLLALLSTGELEAALELLVYLKNNNIPINDAYLRMMVINFCLANKPILAVRFCQAWFKQSKMLSSTENLLLIAESLSRASNDFAAISKQMQPFSIESSSFYLPSHRLLMLVALMMKNSSGILHSYAVLKKANAITNKELRIMMQHAMDLRSTEFAEAVLKESEVTLQSNRSQLLMDFVAILFLNKEYTKAFATLEKTFASKIKPSHNIISFSLSLVKRFGTKNDLFFLRRSFKNMGIETLDEIEKNLPPKVVYRCFNY